jgi:hypothetical protein
MRSNSKDPNFIVGARANDTGHGSTVKIGCERFLSTLHEVHRLSDSAL